MKIWYRQWLSEGDHDSELADGGGLELFDSEKKLYDFLLEEIDNHGIILGEEEQWEEVKVAHAKGDYEPLLEMYREYWYCSDVGYKEVN